MYDLNNAPPSPNERIKSTSSKSFAGLIFAGILIIGGLPVLGIYRGPANLPVVVALEACVFIVACLVYSAVQIADQWEKAVVLRLGKFQGLRGPGLFMIIPFGDSERLVAESFGEAAKTYSNNPVALHLRAMNILKANSTIVIVPSSAVESMDLGGLSGMTALTMGIDQQRKIEATSEKPPNGKGARTI